MKSVSQSAMLLSSHSHDLGSSSVLRRGLKNINPPIWCMPLIGMNSILLSLLSPVSPQCRYDLKSLFEKAFGDFTVNVQGISRVGVFLSLYFAYLTSIDRACSLFERSTGVRKVLETTSSYKSAA